MKKVTSADVRGNFLMSSVWPSTNPPGSRPITPSEQAMFDAIADTINEAVEGSFNEASYQRGIDDAAEAATSLTEDLEVLNGRYDALRARNVEAEKTIVKMAEEIEALAKEAQQLENEKLEAEKTIADMAEEIEVLRDHANDHANEMEEERDAWEVVCKEIKRLLEAFYV